MMRELACGALFAALCCVPLGALNAETNQSTIRPPCALVCPDDKPLNAEKCSCGDPVPPPPPCALVCVNPDETLDARECKCVKK